MQFFHSWSMWASSRLQFFKKCSSTVLYLYGLWGPLFWNVLLHHGFPLFWCSSQTSWSTVHPSLQVVVQAWTWSCMGFTREYHRMQENNASSEILALESCFCHIFSHSLTSHLQHRFFYPFYTLHNILHTYSHRGANSIYSIGTPLIIGIFLLELDGTGWVWHRAAFVLIPQNPLVPLLPKSCHINLDKLLIVATCSKSSWYWCFKQFWLDLVVLTSHVIWFYILCHDWLIAAFIIRLPVYTLLKLVCHEYT